MTPSARIVCPSSARAAELGYTGCGITRASTPRSSSVSRPRSVCTTTRSNRPSSFRQRSRFPAVRRGSRSCAVKTAGLRKRMRDVDLRQREPLDVEHVRSEPRERGGDAEMLDGLQRQPGARAAEHARGERVEALARGGSRRGAAAPRTGTAKWRARRRGPAARAPPRARGRTTACRRAGRRSRPSRSPTVSAVLVRTWNVFHGNTVPPGRRAHLREMIELDRGRLARRGVPAGGSAVGVRLARRLERHEGDRRPRQAAARSGRSR